MARINVALVGIGNIASAFVQAVEIYKETGTYEGIMNIDLGGYKVTDIEFVAAFDVSERKVGKDLAEAIFEPPNIVPKMWNPRKLGVVVNPGPVLDGVAPHMVDVFRPVNSNVSVGDIVDVLKSSRAEILVNLLPVGSEKASRIYAEAALEAGVSFVNAIPVFIASDPTGYYPSRYKDKNIPLLGDDIKGQIGATILHRTLVSLLHMRGVRVDETYQLNVGGNSDFLNMTVEERLESKRISKTRAVTSILPYGEELEKNGKVRIGPSDYVEFLGNTKVCYIYIKGRSFGGFPVVIDAKLSVDDKSMASAILADAIRVAKKALDYGIGGPIYGPSAFLFKHPPVQAPNDTVAREWFRNFVESGKDIDPKKVKRTEVFGFN